MLSTVENKFYLPTSLFHVNIESLRVLNLLIELVKLKFM